MAGNVELIDGTGRLYPEDWKWYGCDDELAIATWLNAGPYFEWNAWATG